MVLLQGVDDEVLAVAISILFGGGIVVSSAASKLLHLTASISHSERPRRTRAIETSDPCAICLDSPSFRTDTLCDHAFCTVQLFSLATAR